MRSLLRSTVWLLASSLAAAQGTEPPSAPVLSRTPPVATGQSPTPAAASTKPFVLTPKDGAALLVLTTDRLPGERLRFITCEAVLDGNNDFGVNQLKLESSKWLREGVAPDEVHSFTWTFEPGVELKFSAKPDADGVDLKYVVTNRTKKTLERVLVHPCFQSIGSPSFFPGTAAQAADDASGRKARTGIRDYSALHDRLFLWSEGEPFAFATSQLAKHERHLAFLARGEKEIAWGWWQNDSRRFDEPWIALQSKDKQKVLGLTFERAAWASANTGDGRACFHLFGTVGKLAPEARGEVKGRIWLVDGDLAAFAKRAAAATEATPAGGARGTGGKSKK